MSQSLSDDAAEYSEAYNAEDDEMDTNEEDYVEEEYCDDEYIYPETPKTPAALGNNSDRTQSAGLKLPTRPGTCLRQTSTSFALVIPSDSYVICTSDEIRPLLDALVHEIAILRSVSVDEAQALLQAYKWDKERLVDRYYCDMQKTREESLLISWICSLLHQRGTQWTVSSATTMCLANKSQASAVATSSAETATRLT
jgi:hypothetical protein